MVRKNKFIYVFIVFVSILIFSCCDSYQSRKKLAAELSLLFNENQTEFDLIEKYFVSDSLFKNLDFRYQDGKIGIGIGDNSIIVDSISNIKDNSIAYQILIFMYNNGIRTIYGNGCINGKAGWIRFAFEDYNRHSPCFNFGYRSDFNPEDENVKREIENIHNMKTTNWTYVLGNGWYIRGVKCF